MKDFSKDILKENIVFSIQQFQRYALMSPVARNSCIINTLENILHEAEKYQTELTEWEKKHE